MQFKEQDQKLGSSSITECPPSTTCSTPSAKQSPSLIRPWRNGELSPLPHTHTHPKSHRRQVPFLQIPSCSPSRISENDLPAACLCDILEPAAAYIRLFCTIGHPNDRCALQLDGKWQQKGRGPARMSPGNTRELTNTESVNQLRNWTEGNRRVLLENQSCFCQIFKENKVNRWGRGGSGCTRKETSSEYTQSQRHYPHTHILLKRWK